MRVQFQIPLPLGPGVLPRLLAALPLPHLGWPMPHSQPAPEPAPYPLAPQALPALLPLPNPNLPTQARPSFLPHLLSQEPASSLLPSDTHRATADGRDQVPTAAEIGSHWPPATPPHPAPPRPEIAPAARGRQPASTCAAPPPGAHTPRPARETRLPSRPTARARPS